MSDLYLDFDTIDDANRLVYLGDSEQNLVILSCKGHYED